MGHVDVEDQIKKDPEDNDGEQGRERSPEVTEEKAIEGGEKSYRAKSPEKGKEKEDASSDKPKTRDSLKGSSTSRERLVRESLVSFREHVVDPDVTSSLEHFGEKLMDPATQEVVDKLANINKLKKETEENPDEEDMNEGEVSKHKGSKVELNEKGEPVEDKKEHELKKTRPPTGSRGTSKKRGESEETTEAHHNKDEAGKDNLVPRNKEKERGREKERQKESGSRSPTLEKDSGRRGRRMRMTRSLSSSGGTTGNTPTGEAKISERMEGVLEGNEEETELPIEVSNMTKSASVETITTSTDNKGTKVPKLSVPTKYPAKSPTKYPLSPRTTPRSLLAALTDRSHFHTPPAPIPMPTRNLRLLLFSNAILVVFEETDIPNASNGQHNAHAGKRNSLIRQDSDERKGVEEEVDKKGKEVEEGLRVPIPQTEAGPSSALTTSLTTAHGKDIPKELNLQLYRYYQWTYSLQVNGEYSNRQKKKHFFFQ